MKGSHPWLVILVVPSDQTAPAWPDVGYFQALLAAGTGGLSDYWSQTSGGAIDLAGSRVLGWYKVTETAAALDKLDRAGAAAVARAAATRAGVDVTGYPHTLAFIVGSAHYGAQGADVAAGVQHHHGQSDWRWCSKCEALSHWAGGMPAMCPGGGRHTYATSLYVVPHGTAGPDGQPGWRWCNKCTCLVHADSGVAPCAGEGNHVTSGSGAYFVRHGSAGDAAKGWQPGWHFCKKCHALSFGAGACAAGGQHDHTGSGAYSVQSSFSAGMGGLAHETAHGFGFGHAFALSRTGDFWNDSRTGAYGDPTDIMSWANSTGFASARFSASGPGMSAPTLIKMGWLGDDALRRDVGAGPASVGLAPLYGAPGSVRALQIVHAAVNRVYTVSLRTATRWDRGFGESRIVVHRNHTLYTVGQDRWYHCSRCEGMVHDGATHCPAGGAHDSSASGEYTLVHDGPPGSGQPDWRYCHRCSGLVFGGGGSPGRCPAGGDHDLTASGNYAVPGSGEGQANWKHCKKCNGMTFGGQAMSGPCPAGGLHDLASSGPYVIGSSTAGTRQAGWRHCAKCNGLHFAAHVPCVGGKPHTLVGDPFGLPHNLDGVPGDAGWRHCVKCHGLSRAAGSCPAGGVHDHTDSGRYVLPIDAVTTGGQSRWFHCEQCSSLHRATATSTGTCTKNRSHKIGGEYVLAHSDAPARLHSFRHCARCSCLVRGDNPAGCAAGGAHVTTGGGYYAVRTEPGAPPRDQPFWRHCSKCSQLMFLKSPDASAELDCPAGGVHTPTGEYFMTLRTATPYWRRCSKCEGLAWSDGSRSPGRCPAGGTHTHVGPYLAPPRRHDDATQLLAEKLVAGDRYLIPDTTVEVRVTAISDAAASIYVTT